MSDDNNKLEAPLRVAVIGAGPAGFYAAGHLLTPPRPVQVDLFDRLPTPFGLVRAGVAPDHPKIKSVVRVYEKIAAQEGFRFFGGVELGRDLHRADLLTRYPRRGFAEGFVELFERQARAKPGCLADLYLQRGWAERVRSAPFPD